VEPKVEVRDLPGTPNALLLVIVGFLCVTLVRDRAKWAAGIVAVVALVGGGVKAVPRLAAGLAARKATVPTTEWSMHVKGEDRSDRAEAAELRYVGLLRRLATEGGTGDGAQMQTQRRAADAVAGRVAAFFFGYPGAGGRENGGGRGRPTATRPRRVEGDVLFQIHEPEEAVRVRPPPGRAGAELLCVAGTF